MQPFFLTWLHKLITFYLFQSLSGYLEQISKLNLELERREQEILNLNLKTKRQRDRVGPDPGHSPPDLEEILRLPLASLERELFMSRHEYTQLVASVDKTILESKRVQSELAGLGERCAAGAIYINTLESDLESAESEGAQLQREFEWIVSLPPSAFASQEMLDWLKKDLNEYDSDSELGLEISASQDGSPDSSTILLPDQRHPAKDPTRSSSTGSTSSGISSDIHSLVSPLPSIVKSKSPIPPLPPKRMQKVFKEDDCNSDTGLSSLNSSAEDQYQFDTLV